MTIKRMDHVGIVVDDLAAAIVFFAALGLVPRGEGQVEGGWVDARPAPANVPGIRHIAFVVDDIDATVAGLMARAINSWSLSPRPPHAQRTSTLLAPIRFP